MLRVLFSLVLLFDDFRPDYGLFTSVIPSLPALHHFDKLILPARRHNPLISAGMVVS